MRRAFFLVLALPLAVALVPSQGPRTPDRPGALTLPVDFAARAGAAEPGDIPADKLVDRVKKSIDAGVAYVRSQQRPDGSWEVTGFSVNNPGGVTSLSLLALLYCGVPANDSAVQKGLAYLRKVKPSQTYVVGLQTMVFALARQPADRERIQRNVNWLLEARQPTGWSYGGRAGMGPDNSNSQYALLGLHEGLLAGAKVDRKALQQIRQLYVRTQSDGGWGYSPGRGGNTLTMTTAGLCNLLITGMDLAAGREKLRPDGSAENCGSYKENKPVAGALAWLGERFPATLTRENAAERLGSVYYALYGIERAGRLTGQRYLGGHDWYEVGCRLLVSTQKANGSWDIMPGRIQLEQHDLVRTAFALLFLAKGRTPVLISKLAYGGRDYHGWNNKRNDARHLVEFASREVFKGIPLAWQAFDVRRTDATTAESRRRLAAELLQSPIVYFNGHDYAPDGKERDVLKEYVSNGGFILVENCCGKARHPNFDKDLREFITHVFGPDAELKALPPEHPIWTASGKFALTPKDFPLMGINQGCKTVLVYSPTPLAGYWEANLFKDRDRGQKAFQLGANIIAYATGLEPPRPRLTQYEIPRDDPPEKIKRGYLKVAQLRHEGDWQPAPKAMRNLMAELRKDGLDVVLQTTPVYPSADGVRDYRFLYMHGRNAFSEKKEDLKKLRFNLKTGGTLLADACCGSKAFDTSFRKFMEALFADDKLKLEPILLGDELFGKELNGAAIRTVRCRRVPAKSGRVSAEYQSVPPALEGVKVKGRWVVIYSRYDLGCALERHQSPDCLGHDYASAVRLGRAAVLYALKR